MNEIKKDKLIKEIYVDEKTRFPVLEFHKLPFAVFWLPITRIQLEHFLSDVNDMRYDANWYSKLIMNNNPRVSPSNVNKNNINGVFATNILLVEARRIANWFGHFKGKSFDLPTREQWETLFNVCKNVPVLPLENISEEIDPRAELLLHRLNEKTPQKSLADQMLLKSSLSEYVYQDESRQSCQITGGIKDNFTSLRESLENVGDRRTNLTFRLILKYS